ncbi:MAG: hypothetical protein M3Y45_02650, partial [Actinomycetota bacterium]|nr:hypothetical protein [Actinomycetota bacterium]
MRFDLIFCRVTSRLRSTSVIAATRARNRGLIRKVTFLYRFDLVFTRFGFAIAFPFFFRVTGTARLEHLGLNRAGHFSRMWRRLPSKIAVPFVGWGIG